jgi:hypothetical protein
MTLTYAGMNLLALVKSRGRKPVEWHMSPMVWDEIRSEAAMHVRVDTDCQVNRFLDIPVVTKTNVRMGIVLITDQG